MSAREFWSIISGRTSLVDKDVIGKELELWNDQLLSGLSFYKAPCSTSHEKVKSSTTVKRKELVFKLSKILNLDEWLTYELLKNYLTTDFRGSSVQLQAILKNDLQVDGFIVKFIEYYFKERQFLLRSTKYLLSYWQDGTCLYREQFSKTVDGLTRKGFVDKVISQLKSLCKTSAIHDGIKGNCLLQSKFAGEFLFEQCELLEILLLYFKDFQMPSKTFVDLANLMRDQHFGLIQYNKKLMDNSAQILIQRFGFVSSLLLVEGLELELLLNASADIADHQLVKDEGMRKNIDELLFKWDDLSEQGPVLMAWTIFRHLVVKDEPEHVNRRFGEAAINCGVLSFLRELIGSPYFNEDADPLAGLVRTLVYHLMTLVLQLFEEQTLGEYEVLSAVVCGSLRERQASQHFWDTSAEERSGGRIFLAEARARFPLRILPLLDLLTATCTSPQATDKVFAYMSELTSFAEPFSVNTVDEVEPTVEPRVWRRTQSRVVALGGDGSGGDVVLPVGTRGQLVNGGNDAARVICWSTTYDGWSLLLSRLDSILGSRSTYGSEEDTIVVLVSIVRIVSAVLEWTPNRVDELQPFLPRVLAMIKCFSHAQSSVPITDLLVSCIKCLRLALKTSPMQIWHEFVETGFPPAEASVDEKDSNSALHVSSVDAGSTSALSLSNGTCGDILAGNESRSGDFSITLAYLDFVVDFLALRSKLAEDIDDVAGFLEHHHKNIVANVVFVVKDIFPNFARWRYTIPAHRDMIGHRCLQIIHSTLFATPEVLQSPDIAACVPSLQDVVTEGLLFHAAGEALLSVISIGVDNIDTCLAIGKSIDTIQMVKLAFSVVNKLMSSRAQMDELTPLENCLCQQIVQQPSDLNFQQATVNVAMLTVIGKYIYHRHDPKLAMLSTIVLRQIALKFPMTLSAIFGDSALALRNIFINRLNGRVEPIRLKIVILELLTACIETQPGIMELFLDLNTDDGKKDAGAKKVLTLGRYSCLSPVLDIIKPNEKSCHVDVLTSTALELLASLWTNRHDTALVAIKCRDGFWRDITSPLRDLQKIDMSKSLLESVSSTMNIIALESYYVKRDQYDGKLKSILSELSNNELSSTVGQLLLSSSKEPESHLKLIKSWKVFITVMAKTKDDPAGVMDIDVQRNICLDTMAALKQSTADVGQRTINFEVCSELANILLIATKSCKRLQNWDGILSGISDLLHNLSRTDEDTFLLLKPTLYSVLLITIQRDNEKAFSSSLLSPLLSTICEGFSRHSPSLASSLSDELLNESLATLSLLSEILERLLRSASSNCVLTIQEHSIIPVLMQMASSCLKGKCNLAFVEATLRLFLSCAHHEQFAEVLSVNGISKFLSLNIEPVSDPKVKDGEDGIWPLAVAIIAKLLKLLRHSFIQDAFDFVGAHSQRLLRSMNILAVLVAHSSFDATKQASALMFELCDFSAEALFALPIVFPQLKKGVGQMAQHAVAFLSRMKILTSLVESTGGESLERLLLQCRSVSPAGVSMFRERTDSTRSLASRDDTSTCTNSPDVDAAQASLFSVLMNCVGAMRRLTPNVIESILDEGLDVDSFDPCLELSFSSPSLDEDTPPCFGTLVSTLNVAFRRIKQLSQSDSDRTSPERELESGSSFDSEFKSSSLWFIIENAIVVLMSQTSCYLRHPRLDPRNKEFLRRELNGELTNFLYAVSRHYKSRRGIPQSPMTSSSSLLTSSTDSLRVHRSPSKISAMLNDDEESGMLRLVDLYTKQLLT